MTGNLKAKKRVHYVKGLLRDLGIEPERVEMYNMSAAQGARFVEVAKEMVERIEKLGPSILKEKEKKVTAEITEKQPESF